MNHSPRALLGVSWPCLLLGLTACNPWYLVESEYQGATIEEKPPEIAEAAVFRSVVGPGISVALSAPDRCADQSAAQATGETEAAGELLAATCGVEMAELERGLVRAGFRVISWNAIRQMVLYGEHLAPLEAAQQLGAVVLFQVNSLERSRVMPGHEVEWNRRFYEWDLNFFQWFFGAGENGSKGDPAEVPEVRAQALEEGMQRLEAAAKPRKQVSININATATLVQSGETIWFYTWTHTEKFRGEAFATQLFECNPQHLFQCFPRYRKQDHVAASGTRSSSRGFVRRSAETASPADAAYYQLVREVVDDMVARFAGA